MFHFAFAYQIEIENQSKSSVQLLTRHWKIIKTMNKTNTSMALGLKVKTHNNPW